MRNTVPGRGASDDYIAVKVPVQHEALAKSMQALVNHVVSEERSAVGSRAIDYARIEDRVAEDVAAIERASHAGILRALEVDALRVTIGGKLHLRIGYSNGTFYTQSGPVEIPHASYRPAGERNGKVVDAITLRTGAYGRGWLPRTAQAMAARPSLAPAAKLIYGDKEGASIFHRWKNLLRKRKSSVDEILRELHTSGCEWRCRDNKQPVHEAITYLENHRDRMFYSSARRQHLPIGSGSAEATCKTLVTMRMKRPGAHWKEQTGEQILKLRALACSDRWDAGMNLLHAQRRTAVRAAA